MEDETEKVTVSIPEDEDYLLKEIDALVEKGRYSNRTEAFNHAIRKMTGIEPYDHLYDSAVSALYMAEKEGKDEIAENARRHIQDTFPQSRMAELLEE